MDQVGTPGVDIEIRTHKIVSGACVRVYRYGIACWHAIPSALACYTWHAIPSALDTQRTGMLYHPQLQDKENMVRRIARNTKTAGKFLDRKGRWKPDVALTGAPTSPPFRNFRDCPFAFT